MAGTHRGALLGVWKGDSNLSPDGSRDHPALDGPSSEQLDRRAEPMSRQKAEGLGPPAADPDSAPAP
jgi:hypothetical protein